MDDSQPNLDTSKQYRVSAEDGADILDRLARKYFGFDGEEFSRRWHAGELQADKHEHALEVAMLLPLGRP